jgi:hypothetical protein
VRNTIISGNTLDNCDTEQFDGIISSQGNNISSDASCPFTKPTDKQNTNPRLGPLANNGGPTDTRALLAGSPAVDAAANTGCPATDQRGVVRPQRTACDIGAYERRNSPLWPGTTPITPARTRPSSGQPLLASLPTTQTPMAMP